MNESIAAGGEVRRFIIEAQPVRGQWVHLQPAWQELRAHREYPQLVRDLLGEAVAASVLLAATLKFSGQLTLQLQGNGGVNLLVAQCTHDFRLRAVAQYDDVAVTAIAMTAQDARVFRQLVGSEGRVTVTIEADERGTRYQGVVPLSGTSLAECLEAYFASSEQLPTRVLLAADAQCCAGVLVQKVPDHDGDDSEVQAVWEAAQQGIEKISAAQLLKAGVEDLLSRGFGSYDVRLFRSTAVKFECRCSPRRVSSLLRALGPVEVRDVLKEQGAVTVTCEFCSRPYRFDPPDVDALFAESPDGAPPSIH